MPDTISVTGVQESVDSGPSLSEAIANLQKSINSGSGLVFEVVLGTSHSVVSNYYYILSNGLLHNVPGTGKYILGIDNLQSGSVFKQMCPQTLHVRKLSSLLVHKLMHAQRDT